jgi:hypothetical protein
MPPEYAGLNSEEVEPEASAFVVTETQYQADNEKGDKGESGVVYLVVARRLQFAQLQPVQRRQPRCESNAQPAGAEPLGADAPSQDQSQSGGHQAAVHRLVPGDARASTERDHP